MTDILYYDGRCPLCVKEMDKLRRIKADTLHLVDIHSLDDAAPTRPPRETLLKVLHLMHQINLQQTYDRQSFQYTYMLVVKMTQNFLYKAILMVWNLIVILYHF